MAVADVRDDRVHLLLEGAVDLVVLVASHHREVGRDDHRLEVVDLLELERLGVGRARHARELLVHAEVVLERDRRQRLVLALDRHAFLRLDRLVQAVGPAASRHQAAGELVDDDHLAVLHDVVLVAVEQRVRAQRGVEVMDEPDVGRVVEAGARRDQAGRAEQPLGLLVALLGEQHLVRLLVDPVVAGALLLGLLHEPGRDLVEPVVGLDVVVRLAGDDERRARLVDQDRVHLVDDRVREQPLHAFGGREHHVVAQVVEAELVVGAVGDVGRVRRLLLVVRHLREIDADGEPQEAVDAAHPVRVALREVVVHRDDVHALAGERIEVRRQRGDERLAFAGAHLGDLAVVQGDAAEQLDVEVAHAERALARLAHDGERLGQHVVERRAVRDALLELGRLRPQRLVGKGADRRLERIDLAHLLAELLEQPFVAAAEDAGEDVRDHASTLLPSGQKTRGEEAASPLTLSSTVVVRALVRNGQLVEARNRAGFCGTPFSRTSKWRCGPVERPVDPTLATRWPRTTRSPSPTAR